MNWNNVKLVFLREVRDQLRDRRTLFMVAVLPLLLYPALGLGMLQMTLMFSEQTRTVVILGAKDLPDPPLVENGRFREEFFEFPSDAEKLRVIGDDVSSSGTEDVDLAAEPADDELLRAAANLRERLGTVASLEAEAEAARQSGRTDDADAIEARVKPLKASIGEAMSAAGIQVLILVPEGLRQRIAEINETRPAGDRARPADAPRLRIVRNSADEKSLAASRRVKEAVGNWEDRLLQQRLESYQLPDSFPKPVDPDQIDLAQEQQLAASVWSKLFPALLIIMAVTGAFYPAVDLGAGEKERGTMETLLISPATRTEIVIGKFLTVLLFSMGTALLNMASMGFTGKHMLSIAGAGKLSQFGAAAFPPLSSLMWVIVLAIPLAALFSSVSLGLAMFARSSKEGQYYLTPLLMVTMGLTVFTSSSAVEITPFYSVMPVVGPALLLKALLLSTGESTSLYWYAIPVLASSIAYCALGLWWAIEQFQREDILFREAEQFDLRLWMRHLLRDKEPTPSFTEAGFCFILIMLLQFAGFRFLRDAGLGANPQDMMRLLIIQQLVIIATPALMMAVMLTTSLRQTLKLNWAPLKYFAVAILLAVVLRPLSSELVTYLVEMEFLPDLDESIKEQMVKMLDLSQAGWLVFLGFAVAAGICEDLAFRGFILSGFSRSRRTGLAIALSALAFGIMHLIPQQVFNATLLGLVLGLIAVRSNSLLPGVVFHILYNGMEVLLNRVPPAVWDSPFVQRFVTIQIEGEQAALRYTWPLLILCGAIAAMLLAWLIRQRASSRRTPAESAPERTHLPTAPAL
ncbi:MAG: ABC transporter permease subunit [Planctomycetaceae bacterium]|nr:ABC transporter permease subunit [Planctomycetaceae bacterium]